MKKSKKIQRIKRTKIYRLIDNYLKKLFFFIILSSACLGFAQEHADAQVSLEVGGDSNERRYFRPCLRFSFPIKPGKFFVEMDYIQRINSELGGEVDFWLSTGYIQLISHRLSFDASLQHLCRHKTSQDYPEVLDINEIFARLWLKKDNFRVGFGSGTFLGESSGYDHLMIFNLSLPRIFGSEFSEKTEIKLIDLKEILYDLELSCSMGSSLDLFLRYTKHYQYQKTAYMGIRVRNNHKTASLIDKLKFRAGIHPFQNEYKLAGSHEFKLEFLESSKSRVLLIMTGKIPVFWERGFIGPYRPEKIMYPLSLQYEKKVRSALFAAVYFRYHISMPVDVGERFSSDLGAGLALRNQRNFDELRKKMRFEIFAGQNFSHTADIGARLGWNSVGKDMDFGTNLEMTWNPEEWTSSAEFFIESGKDIRIRPFIGFQRDIIFNVDQKLFLRFLIGIELIKWN